LVGSTRCFSRAGLILALVGGIVTSSAPRAQVLRTVGQLYSPTSPWNLPIPKGASVDPNSAVMVQTVVTAGAQRQGFVIAVKRYTRPIYLAPAGTPTYTVRLTARWASTNPIIRVPIPSNAMPDPGSDGHVTILDPRILDPKTACEYDLWQAARQPDGSWTAGWGNATSARGNGWLPMSATGSGAAGAAGLMLPEEFQAGVITHALAFSYPFTKAGGPVLPAMESDGRSTVVGAIPEGAQLQLDPALDLVPLGLRPYELIIARAMQQYGLFLMDTNSGGVSLYAQNPQSTILPYPWPDQTYVNLPSALLPHLRVLKLGPQYGPSNTVQQTACASFTS